MADDNGKPAPAADDPKPPAGKPEEPNTPPAGDGKSQADEPLTLETKKKLDKEAKQLRRERDEAQAELKKLQDSQLSETERAQARLKELETKEAEWASTSRDRQAWDSFLDTVLDDSDKNLYRVKSLQAAKKAFKLYKDDLEYDKSGDITNLQAVLKSAKADFPELFGSKSAGSVNGGEGGKTNLPVTDMNAAIRGAAGRGQ